VIAMPLARILDIAASAMAAQAQRLNVTASNLANAESVTGPNGQPYRARQVIFSSADVGGGTGVRVTGIMNDPAPGRRVFDPGHPLADQSGHVAMPNVNAVEEMVNMISASRAYQNNVELANTARQLMLRALTLGQ